MLTINHDLVLLKNNKKQPRPMSLSFRPSFLHLVQEKAKKNDDEQMISNVSQ